MLQRLLGLGTPSYMHIPLVMGADGHRLAKRHGAVTLRELRTVGVTSGDVLGWIATSIGLAHEGERVTSEQLVTRYDPHLIPRTPIDQPTL